MRAVKLNQLIPGILWLVIMIWLMQVSRSNFIVLWSSYTIAFVAYAWLILRDTAVDLKMGLAIALIARLVSFLFDPQLSDDYFRFIWDGMVMNGGVHPMAYTPSFLMGHPEILPVDSHFYHALNSPDYYSVYPPVAQWVFGIAYRISGPDLYVNILCYKTVILAAEGTIVFLLFKLLQKRQLSEKRVLIFALNPLIVLEFMGNLHMDVLMIAGLLGALYFVEEKNLPGSVGAMTLSILSKMLTLVLLPFVHKKEYWKKTVPFGIFTLGLSGLVFWLSFGAYTGWLTSIGLWFQSFEFNASLYYLVRGVGYLIKGHNMISLLGPALAVVFLAGVLGLWLRYIRDTSFNSPQAMLYVLTLFFLCSTTVHPWYIGTLLVLSVLSLHVYPIVWTYLVVLSYSHYQGGGFIENYWLIASEYILLTAFIYFEWRLKRNQREVVTKGHKKTLV